VTEPADNGGSPEPLDYANAKLADAKPGSSRLVLAVVFAFASVAVTWSTAEDAWRIYTAGRFHPGISFWWRLSLKAYHVQWPPVVWLLPLGGIVWGVVAERDGWRRVGRLAWIVSLGSAASWLAVDLIW
jgi:hypothetical protein